MVNASLSYGDISQRNRLIRREAERAWNMGKQLGLEMEGDSENTILKISDILVSHTLGEDQLGDR